MVVLQKYRLKNGTNAIQIRYWLDDDLTQRAEEVPLNYSPGELVPCVRLPEVEVTKKKLEELIKIAGFWF